MSHLLATLTRLGRRRKNTVMANKGTRLKALLKQRHLQEHRAFCSEYDRVAAAVDLGAIGGYPSKATFYRWLSGDMLSLPHPSHCRILEAMFPEWTAAALFEAGDNDSAVARSVATETPSTSKPTESPRETGPNVPTDLVALYAHRSDTPKDLWMNLVRGARENIDLFAYASLFLPEDNPGAIRILREKASQGVKVRILLGDPNDEAIALRGREERLFEAIPGRIKMALAYYKPLVGVEGISFRLHNTSLYNSIFRYDDQMLVNQHIYGTYGYIAPILHLQRQENSDLFDTYMTSLELIWEEESRDLTLTALSG
jgi:hypothetical protein